MTPDDGLTSRHPAELPSRMTVRLKSDEPFTNEISDFAGAPSRPLTWEEIEAKIDRLTADHANETSRQVIKNAVRSLENVANQRPDEISWRTQRLRISARFPDLWRNLQAVVDIYDALHSPVAKGIARLKPLRSVRMSAPYATLMLQLTRSAAPLPILIWTLPARSQEI